MLHSHTNCKATQANAKTQAWQRVCLPKPHNQNDRQTIVGKRTPKR